MRVFALLVAVPLLAGCSSLDVGNLLSFGHSDTDDAPQPTAVAAATPAPAATPAAPNGFCMDVARQDASSNFDTATQQRMVVRSYQQCAVLFASQQ